MNISKYFEGRSNRRDYFIGFLAIITVSFVVSAPIFFVVDYTQDSILLRLVYAFPVLLSLPVACRRMQDVGHSGGWVFIPAVLSFFGVIAASGFSALLSLLLFVWPSNKKENEYGSVPVSVGGFLRPLWKGGSVPVSKNKD